MTNHPITPPDELLEHWRVVGTFGNWQNALTLAYRAGADQELEACAEWVNTWCISRYLGDAISADVLRAARRPKPPSLAKRALHILGTHGDLSCAEHDTIRRALEALDD